MSNRRSMAPPGGEPQHAVRGARASEQILVPPPMKKTRDHFTDALILTGMTFACTALSVYDLILLATNL
jgi:hypothetical protein